MLRLPLVKESKQSAKLASEISRSITKIDDSMSYSDFAQAVATVLKNEYGSHNYEPFIRELKKSLL